MTIVTPMIYAIRKSIEGYLLGLDNTESTTQKGNYTPFLMGRDFKGLRLFKEGQFGQQGNDYKVGVSPAQYKEIFDDFLGTEISPVLWNALKGSDTTPVAPAIHVADNGTIRLTTGSDATSTMATNGSQLTGALDWLVSAGEITFEARLGNLSAATDQSICFGLADVSTISAPFTLSTATVTATGTNGVAFLQDSRGTNTALNCVSVNAAGTPAVNALTNSINTTTGKYNTYRITLDAAGNAYFFIDGALVATQLLAVATTAVLCPSIGAFCSTASAQTMDVDYLLLQGLRG